MKATGILLKIGIAACAVATGLLVLLAILFGGAAVFNHTEFNRAQTAEPIRMSVDLSSPGRYEGELLQTYTLSHGEELLVEIAPAFESPEQARVALAGLRANLSIADPSGKQVLAVPIAYGSWPPRGGDESEPPTDRSYNSPRTGHPGWVLCMMFPFGCGKYRLVLDVREPAGGLSGRSHTLVARYNLCGGEYAATYFCGILAAACLVAGVVAGLVARRLWRRLKRPLLPAAGSS